MVSAISPNPSFFSFFGNQLELRFRGLDLVLTMNYSKEIWTLSQTCMVYIECRLQFQLPFSNLSAAAWFGIRLDNVMSGGKIQTIYKT